MSLNDKETNVEGCPREGCAAVQVLASQLDDSVAQATQCLDDMTKANREFLVSMTEAKMLAAVQGAQLSSILAAVAKLTDAVATINTDVAVLKNRPTDGASTTLATAIATTIAGVVAGVAVYFKN